MKEEDNKEGDEKGENGAIIDQSSDKNAADLKDAVNGHVGSKEHQSSNLTSKRSKQSKSK